MIIITIIIIILLLTTIIIINKADDLLSLTSLPLCGLNPWKVVILRADSYFVRIVVKQGLYKKIILENKYQAETGWQMLESVKAVLAENFGMKENILSEHIRYCFAKILEMKGNIR